MIDITQIPDPILPEHFDTTHIDILGRGPSVDSYIPRQGAFVICCHYPMVRCDAIASTRFGQWGFYPIPYIVTRKQRQKEIIKVEDWVVLATKKQISKDNSIYNTGEIAYLWACAQKPKSIHLWGFDSLFDVDRTWNHSKDQVKVAVEKYNPLKIYGDESYVDVCKKSSDKWVHKAIKQNLKSHTTIHKGN
jgi:hypothetical protein